MILETGGQDHWDKVYATRAEDAVSWFQPTPEISLELIRELGDPASLSLVDIGGGMSRLVDALVAAGNRDVAVLDISPVALDLARKRLGAAAVAVDWIAADVTRWRPARQYAVWHDRAAFHFLTGPQDREAYVEALHAAVGQGGHAVIATFAADGPERCSGLPVVRYEPGSLAQALGPRFELVAERRQVHSTPQGYSQSFQFSVLRRVA